MDAGHQITDDEFQQMVEEAERHAKCEHLCAVVGYKRFKKILAFEVDLREMNLTELIAHFEFVRLMAE